MVCVQRCFVFLCVVGATFGAYAKRKVEIKLESGKLTLKSAKEDKPLFVFANKSENNPLIKLFFHDSATFVFDAARMQKQEEPTAKHSSVQSADEQVASVEQSTENQGQEDTPSSETMISNKQSTSSSISEKEKVVSDYPLYRAVVDQMTLEEARELLKNQSYVAQTYYMIDTLWKGNPIAQAKAIVMTALEKLEKLIKIYKKKSFAFTIDIENKVDPLAQVARPLYNGVKGLSVIGFDMPNIDAWYIRHKGKIALGAVGIFALLAFARYGNALGTTTQPTTPVTPPVVVPAVPAQSSWMGRQTARVAQYIANLGTKHGVTEAAKAHGIQVKPPSGIKATIEAKVGKIAHDVAIRHQAKLVPPAAAVPSRIERAIGWVAEKALESDKLGIFKEKNVEPWLKWEIKP
jgi:hypothetical protein